MNQNSSKKLRFIILFIALPLVLSKLLWSGTLFFLTKSSSKNIGEKNYNYHYNLRIVDKIIGSHVDIPTAKVEVDDGQKLDDIKLKGTYIDGDNSFIIIEDGDDSKFIYIGENFRGYKLLNVSKSKVIFEKSGKNFYVLLSEEDASNEHSFSDVSDEEELIEPASLNRSDISAFVKDPDKIWKNIRIQEQRTNGQISGFRVNYIKKGSFFDKAGLKSGDVIKGIDGNEIKSLADVMKYYTNVESLESLSLSILRGGNELELDFSVN